MLADRLLSCTAGRWIELSSAPHHVQVKHGRTNSPPSRVGWLPASLGDGQHLGSKTDRKHVLVRKLQEGQWYSGIVLSAKLPQRLVTENPIPDNLYICSPARTSAMFQVITRSGTNALDAKRDFRQDAPCEYCHHPTQDEAHIYAHCTPFASHRAAAKSKAKSSLYTRTACVELLRGGGRTVTASLEYNSRSFR